jgi:hypothetical protein
MMRPERVYVIAYRCGGGDWDLMDRNFYDHYSVAARQMEIYRMETKFGKYRVLTLVLDPEERLL